MRAKKSVPLFITSTVTELRISLGTEGTQEGSQVKKPCYSITCFDLIILKPGHVPPQCTVLRNI